MKKLIILLSEKPIAELIIDMKTETVDVTHINDDDILNRVVFGKLPVSYSSLLDRLNYFSGHTDTMEQALKRIETDGFEAIMQKNIDMRVGGV